MTVGSKKQSGTILVIVLVGLGGFLMLRNCTPEKEMTNDSAPDRRSSRVERAQEPDRPKSVAQFSSDWNDPVSGATHKIRKIFELESIPSVEAYSDRAIATVEICVTEHAEIRRNGRRAWERMLPEEFERWRGGAGDSHQVTANLEKVWNDETRTSSIRKQEIIGDGTRKKSPGTNYSETESGINITLEWGINSIIVYWRASQTERQSDKILLPFSERFREPESDGKMEE